MLRLAAGSLVYGTVGLAIMWAFKKWFPAEATVLVMFTLIGVLVVVPFFTLIWRHLASFEVDEDGIHQLNTLQWYQNQIARFEDGGALSWNTDLLIVPCLPWMIVLIRHQPPGAVLTRLRQLFKPQRSFLLPRRWLVGDLGRLQAALSDFAPNGHPLRALYAVPDQIASSQMNALTD